jgi:transglutaminase-like putative cysteine protease
VDALDLDFWQRPAETFERRRGDCEDMAVLLASLLITSGISAYNVRVVFGSVYDRQRGELGHAWVMYKTERGEWVPLDILAAVEEIPTAASELTASNLPVAQYRPRYCFNRDHVWAVGPTAEWDTKVIENINQYGDEIHTSRDNGSGIEAGRADAVYGLRHEISAQAPLRDRISRERTNGNHRFGIDANEI